MDDAVVVQGAGLVVAHESTKCSHVNCKVADLPQGQVLRVYHHNNENKCSGRAGEQHQCAITQEKECECHVMGTHPWSHYRQQGAGSVVKAVALVSGMRMSSFSEAVSDGVAAAVTVELGVLPEQVQIVRARATPEDDGVLFDVCVSVKDTKDAGVARDEMEAIKTTTSKAASFNSLLHQELMSALMSKGESTSFLTDEDKARVRVRLWDEAAMATEELHNARKSEGQELKDNVHAADFRLMMRNQQLFYNTFQLMDEAERAAGVRLVVSDALGKIALPSLGADEEDALRNALAQHLPALSVIFKYYCSFSRGGNVSTVGGSTATMSFVEFQAFFLACHNGP